MPLYTPDKCIIPWYSFCNRVHMALYQEMPKESIMTVLQEHFSREELDAVRLEVNALLLTCNSMNDLQDKIFQILKSKKALTDFKKIHEANFIGS